MALRVLVVDDDALVRRALCRALDVNGWRVESSSGGSSALAIIERGELDVLVTDLDMPEVGGYQLLAAAASAAPTAYRILMTGSSDQIDGAVAHLVVRKPDIMQIRRAIAEYVAQSS